MAHRKAGGSTKNTGGAQPKYLGLKKHDGELVHSGNILVRQRGTVVVPGNANVRIGKDHTLFAVASGKVKFFTKRKQHFNGSFSSVKAVSVV